MPCRLYLLGVTPAGVRSLRYDDGADVGARIQVHGHPTARIEAERGMMRCLVCSDRLCNEFCARRLCQGVMLLIAKLCSMFLLAEAVEVAPIPGSGFPGCTYATVILQLVKTWTISSLDRYRGLIATHLQRTAADVQLWIGILIMWLFAPSGVTRVYP